MTLVFFQRHVWDSNLEPSTTYCNKQIYYKQRRICCALGVWAPEQYCLRHTVESKTVWFSQIVRYIRRSFGNPLVETIEVCHNGMSGMDEKNADDEVHAKKEETGREESEETINIVTNRWINVVFLLSGRIHPPSPLPSLTLTLSLLKGKIGGSLVLVCVYILWMCLVQMHASL